MEADLCYLHTLLECVPKTRWSKLKRKIDNGDKPRGMVIGIRPWHIWKSGGGKTGTSEVARTYHYQSAAMWTWEGLDLWMEIAIFMKKWYPKFKYNAGIINKSAQYVIHKDSRNMTHQSWTCSFGDFNGGELILYDEQQVETERVDTNYQPLIFDGSSVYHSVAPFTGERLSLVLYFL